MNEQDKVNWIHRLITDRMSVLQMIRLRSMEPTENYRAVKAMCPSDRARCSLNYFSFSDAMLQEELSTINDMLNKAFDEIDLKDLSKLLNPNKSYNDENEH